MDEVETENETTDTVYLSVLECGSPEIETVYYDANMLSEYERIVAEADELERQNKLALETTILPSSSLISPASLRDSASESSIIVNYGKLLNTNRTCLSYTLTKVPKAEQPKDAAPVLRFGNDNANRVDFPPDPKGQTLKRKLSEVDGSLKTTSIPGNGDQDIKPATPVGFACAWKDCGYINKTEGKTIRHIQNCHFHLKNRISPIFLRCCTTQKFANTFILFKAQNNKLANTFFYFALIFFLYNGC